MLLSDSLQRIIRCSINNEGANLRYGMANHMLFSISFPVYHVKCDRNMSHALMCMHRNDYMSLSDSFQRVRLCRSIVKERLMVCLIFCLSFSSVNENDCDTCAVFA